MNTRANILILAAVLAAALIGGIFLWRAPQNTGTTNTVSTYERLLKTNPDFATAQGFAVAKDYTKAQSAYEAALRAAPDIAQEGQILSRLAGIKDSTGDHLGAIADWKKIAADTRYALGIRAYAVQYMGTMRLKYFDPNIRAAITKEIFKDSPYSTMWVPNDTALSYRHLFEYASSLYPGAVSELMIADWYAGQLIVSSTTPEMSGYASIIQNKLSSAEEGIARLEKVSFPPGISLVPISLTREAGVKAKLARAGLSSPEVAEAAFKKAIDAYVSYGYKPGDEGFARYHYAVYLSRLGASKADDIETVLAPFSTDPAYGSSLAASYFKAGRTNLQGQKARLQILAQLDMDFKKFLTSLGWTSGDFVPAAK